MLSRMEEDSDHDGNYDDDDGDDDDDDDDDDLKDTGDLIPATGRHL